MEQVFPVRKSGKHSSSYLHLYVGVKERPLGGTNKDVTLEVPTQNIVSYRNTCQWYYNIWEGMLVKQIWESLEFRRKKSKSSPRVTIHRTKNLSMYSKEKNFVKMNDNDMIFYNIGNLVVYVIIIKTILFSTRFHIYF